MDENINNLEQPNQTLYINNLNEKIKTDGKISLFRIKT
jgi:hypothetical protein